LKRKVLGVLVTLVLVLGVSLVIPVVASAASIDAATNDATARGATDAASNGNTISVNAGYCTEGLAVDEGVSFVSDVTLPEEEEAAPAEEEEEQTTLRVVKETNPWAWIGWILGFLMFAGVAILMIKLVFR